MAERTLYWVMYNETNKTSRSDEPDKFESKDCQHYGTEDLDSAKKTVLEFRDLASRGKHYCNSRQWPHRVLNSAWIEVEHRTRLEF